MNLAITESVEVTVSPKAKRVKTGACGNKKGTGSKVKAMVEEVKKSSWGREFEFRK